MSSCFRHEHLYEKIERNIIVSDQFPKTVLDGESKLRGAKVILCTLSMMANPKLSVFTQAVPVETVIVDEASQIETGNYVPLLHLFKTTVAKLVFIGDDKQRKPNLYSLSSYSQGLIVNIKCHHTDKKIYVGFRAFSRYLAFDRRRSFLQYSVRLRLSGSHETPI